MVHDLLPVDFVSELLESVGFLKDGIVNFESGHTELIQALEKLTID